MAKSDAAMQTLQGALVKSSCGLLPLRGPLLALAFAMLLGCEAPMLGVSGRVSTEEGRPLGGFEVHFLQLDGQNRIIGRDSARVASDGAFGRMIIRAEEATRLRFTVEIPGYRHTIVEMPITKDTVDFRRDLILRH